MNALPLHVSPPVTGPTDPEETLGCWGEQLKDSASPISWLWDGILAPGNVTLLTSQWKSGKTTLLSVLLSRMKEGGSLAGLSVRAGRAIVVTEETKSLWGTRHAKLDLGHVYFVVQPFLCKPTMEQWLGLLDRLRSLQAKHKAELVVIDTLTTFLPGRNEAVAGLMMEALLPLRRLTEQGTAVLLPHHPAKGANLAGQAARGSGALASFSDINLEMSWHRPNDTTDRRRRILGYSRHEQTPRQLLIELNEAGTDYLVHSDFGDDGFAENWKVLCMVLEDAKRKQTRAELLSQWPADFPRPHEGTLHRWLDRAVKSALLCRDGTGRKAEPFRYWLPAKMEEWRRDPMYELLEQAERSREEAMRRWGSSGPV